jgi:transcription-repair coupling factor (superfamily II helicase)
MSQSRPSPLNPVLPDKPGTKYQWGHLYGNSAALAIIRAAAQHNGPLLVVTGDSHEAQLLESALHFFNGEDGLPIVPFPDWETLPYDAFSPHQDIISERLAALARLPRLEQGILLVPVQTLMHRLAPRSYLDTHSLLLDTGQTLKLDEMRQRLEAGGYRCVATVMEHGEFAVRGSLLDLYPMGSPLPYRIELFDDEIESIRSFDPETQRSIKPVEQVRLLPAREFPLDKAGIARFRQGWRARFEGNPQQSTLYREVSNGMAPAGIEYYLPLFHEQTQTLFNYLPESSLIFTTDSVEHAAEVFWREIGERYEQLRYDQERPLLPPPEMFVPAPEAFAGFKTCPRVQFQHFELETTHGINFATAAPPGLNLDVRAPNPTAALENFLTDFKGRVLFAAETTGRREYLLDLLRGHDIHPAPIENWTAFLESNTKLGITVAPLEQGVLLTEPPLAVIAEPQLFGLQVLQRRRRKRAERDTDAIIRNLAELTLGAPVVHEDYGVGRYLGLQTLHVGETDTEFLTLEYAGGDKLYVPVASLHLISRYTGAAPDSAPLHKLGSGQWEKARRKATERVRDVAAELLAIYAKRESRHGYQYHIDEAQYRAFAAEFPFEETPDQQAAIDNVLASMRDDKPMDHLVCGDVGFGKTEVAMRAAFVAVQAGKQVSLLAPTTLLTQQHLENFRDRFANWPVRIEALSRFSSKKEQNQVLADLKAGKVDIIIGTHKLLQDDVKYANLGLVIIDEEHRFGVRQKEKFKALRAEVDVLTLTATPIPRTLNMAMSGMRDLSIIATPPARRLAIKTFVTEWKPALIREACLREIHRGGQVYFLHNEVESIEKEARKLSELVPEATVHYAHGQMRERELEQVMSDFYHQRFNILVCTTIIETGIDIPTANTIIMNRADRFGLAQLYQLRGRVGRSHHRAYAYLMIPSRQTMTADARKRLEAIESIESLGTGFTLATHDLEIRGAGELLGEEQSGQIMEIGYNMYTELLERAVNSLKEGKEPDLTTPLHHATEIDLHVPALIPEHYLPDVHERLIMYKRIASAANKQELHELQVEMIDRFGLVPDPVKTLFRVTELKLKASPLGIEKIDMSASGGRLLFTDKPDIDPARIIQLIQTQPNIYRLDGNDKLRIHHDLPDADSRLHLLNNLLDDLRSQEAA